MEEVETGRTPPGAGQPGQFSQQVPGQMRETLFQKHKMAGPEDWHPEVSSGLCLHVFTPFLVSACMGTYRFHSFTHIQVRNTGFLPRYASHFYPLWRLQPASETPRWFPEPERRGHQEPAGESSWGHHWPQPLGRGLVTLSTLRLPGDTGLRHFSQTCL